MAERRPGDKPLSEQMMVRLLRHSTSMSLSFVLKRCDGFLTSHVMRYAAF